MGITAGRKPNPQARKRKSDSAKKRAEWDKLYKDQDAWGKWSMSFKKK